MAHVPDSESSLDFLERFHPGGPWILTAIEPDRKGIKTATFTADQLEEVREFIEDSNQTRNIYFSVNPTKAPIAKKASRADIAALTHLHVDIDPRAGHELRDERERALRLLTDPPGDIPKPTCVVFSGGGYQGFWALKEPMPIDGQPDKYALAARYNKTIEQAFEADHCHNVDRIMRLPGTINWPDEKKRAKGRRPALAEVIFFDDVTHPLADFTPAPEQDHRSPTGSPSGSVQIDRASVSKLSGVEDLPADLADWAKVLIVQGHDPENPGKHESRSEALFAVVCEMVRCPTPIDDATIYAVLLDPDFGISASVLDQGSGANRYALRQIERAREFAIAPELHELNDRYFVSDYTGKTRVYRHEPDPELPERFVLRASSFEDFRNLHLNRKVKVGEDKDGKDIKVPLGKWWLEHPMRRQYSAVVCDPGNDRDGVYNLWRGFAVEPRPGDCSKMHAHIREVVADGDTKTANYIERWLAWTVQNPGQPSGTVLVMRGEQGTGKGVLGRTVADFFGAHGLHLTSTRDLTGNFNAHLQSACFVFGDEVFASSDTREIGKFKTLITEKTLTIEPKGHDQFTVPNRLSIIMASNAEHPVHVEPSDRRFIVVDVSSAKANDADYFGALFGELGAGGREAFLHHLLALELGDWHPQKDRIETLATSEQKKLSLIGFNRVLHHVLEIGEAVGWMRGKSIFVPSAALEALSDRLLGRGKLTAQTIRYTLYAPQGDEPGTRGSFAIKKSKYKNVNGYELPALPEMRRLFDKKRGMESDWDDSEEWTAIDPDTPDKHTWDSADGPDPLG